MDKCQFKYGGRKCTAETSKDKPFIYHGKKIPEFAIARCKSLCPIHYNQVKKDNIRKFHKLKDIPKALDFEKKLAYNEIWSYFGLQKKVKKLNPKEVKKLNSKEVKNGNQNTNYRS